MVSRHEQEMTQVWLVLKNMLNLSNSRLDIVEENFSELRYQKKLFIVKTREEKIWIEET